MDIDLGRALDDAAATVSGWAEGLVGSLPDIVAALLVLLFFWGVATLVRNALLRILERVSQHRSVQRLLATVAYGAVLAVGIFAALGILELDRTVTSLLAGAGIVALALGFAFQDTAENFISGVLLAFRRPFREGDVVETNDHMGVVEAINLRATMLRTFEGQRVYIPNSTVFQNSLVNYTELGRRRVDLACGVAYGDDLERAREVAVQAIEPLEARDPGRPVEFFYEGFGDSSIDFVVRFWIGFSAQPQFLAARSEAIVALKKALDEAGLTIPFPIRTLDFGVVGGRSLAEEAPGLGRGSEVGGRSDGG